MNVFGSSYTLPSLLVEGSIDKDEVKSIFTKVTNVVGGFFRGSKSLIDKSWHGLTQVSKVLADPSKTNLFRGGIYVTLAIKKAVMLIGKNIPTNNERLASVYELVDKRILPIQSGWTTFVGVHLGMAMEARLSVLKLRVLDIDIKLAYSNHTALVLDATFHFIPFKISTILERLDIENIRGFDAYTPSSELLNSQNQAALSSPINKENYFNDTRDVHLALLEMQEMHLSPNYKGVLHQIGMEYPNPSAFYLVANDGSIPSTEVPLTDEQRLEYNNRTNAIINERGGDISNISDEELESIYSDILNNVESISDFSTSNSFTGEQSGDANINSDAISRSHPVATDCTSSTECTYGDVKINVQSASNKFEVQSEPKIGHPLYPLSASAINALVSDEGFVPYIYFDVAGYPTIGAGVLLSTDLNSWKNFITTKRGRGSLGAYQNHCNPMGNRNHRRGTDTCTSSTKHFADWYEGWCRGARKGQGTFAIKTECKRYVNSQGKLLSSLDNSGTIEDAGVELVVSTSLNKIVEFNKGVARQLGSVVVNLSKHEYAGVLSFAYNLGTGAIKSSDSMYKYLIKPISDRVFSKKNHPDRVFEVFTRQHRANGIPLRGLFNRRIREAMEFLGASGSEASYKEKYNPSDCKGPKDCFYNRPVGKPYYWRTVNKSYDSGRQLSQNPRGYQLGITNPQ